ncbi:unnamed protein product [Dracunculus medinensis]|uniref:Uncharacterized protein n=1 Tax=Dracunculus medinensis TaxID=318479 RepID=A0A0N4U9D0_DRAME|nr:unnamed protein product [Dracunculus medinensis]
MIVRKNPEAFAVDHSLPKSRSNENITYSDNKLKRHSIGGHLMRSPEDYAATKIQAEIRGFLARKHIRDMKKESDKAATRIQSNIRGFLTRKHLEKEGIVLSHHSNDH